MTTAIEEQQRCEEAMQMIQQTLDELEINSLEDIGPDDVVGILDLIACDCNELWAAVLASYSYFALLLGGSENERELERKSRA